MQQATRDAYKLSYLASERWDEELVPSLRKLTFLYCPVNAVVEGTRLTRARHTLGTRHRGLVGLAEQSFTSANTTSNVHAVSYTLKLRIAGSWAPKSVRVYKRCWVT